MGGTGDLKAQLVGFNGAMDVVSNKNLNTVTQKSVYKCKS
jgi:hypothetical protein